MATVKPVAQWTTYEDAKQAVDSGLPADYETVRKIVEDQDYWLNGDGWLGHRTGDSVVDSAMRERIKPQFVADDVLGELIENRTNGLIGQEADVQLEPREQTDDETLAQTLDTEAEEKLAALAAWWDTKRFWEQVASAADRVSFARRGSVRPFVADANLLNGRLPTGKTFAEALALIDLDAPAAGMAVRYVDPTTQRPAAVILGKQIIDGGLDRDRAEVWTVDPITKKTVVRVFIQGGTAQAPLPVDLGGRLPFGEMRDKRLVTESLRRTQSLLNFIMTVTGRTVESAGFRSVHVTNAEPHLLWLTSRPQSTPVVAMVDRNGAETKIASEAVLWGVATPPMFGAGVLNEWQGIRSVDKDRNESFETPGVTALDPVDPAFATNAADAVRKVMYQRGKQGHLAIDSSVQASGTAYQQARAQHEADLKRLKGPCEGMMRDVLEAVLAMAGEMSEDAKGLLDRFRLVVNLRISAGPITTEDATNAVLLRDKRAISQQTMQARLGVEDPSAEQTAIDADPMVRADFWNKIAPAITAIVSLTGTQMTAEGAGFLLGLTVEQLEVLRTGVPPVATEPTAPKLVA
jgi:hypothetical protein